MKVWRFFVSKEVKNHVVVGQWAQHLPFLFDKELKKETADVHSYLLEPIFPSKCHLLENAPVLSEALWNKPVDCVLLGVSGAWWARWHCCYLLFASTSCSNAWRVAFLLLSI